MTTTVLDRVPVDEISERARKVRPGTALMRLVTGILFGIGWVLAKIFAVAWTAFTWTWAAVAEGWEAAHGPSRGKQIDALTAQVAEQAAQLRRLGG